MFTKHGKEEKRRPVVAALATLGLTAATIAATSGTAFAGDTQVTFTVVATGGLGISAPAVPVNLTDAGKSGETVSGSLGAVTVTDNRTGLNLGWVAKATSTAFTTGTKTAEETIPATAVSYSPGAVTGTGVGVFTPIASPGVLGAVLPVVTATGTVGDNAATWTPTISVAVPEAAVVGLYTATLTHSVV